MIQAIIAAQGDYFTWRLGQKVYGDDSYEAWAVVCSIHSRTNELLIKLVETRLILSLSAEVACIYCLQSMAVVLLHSHFIQLFRDYFDHNGLIFVAMALVTEK